MRTRSWLVCHSACTGGYFVDCKLEPLNALASNDTRAQEMWAVSEQLCGLSEEERAVAAEKSEAKKFL